MINSRARADGDFCSRAANSASRRRKIGKLIFLAIRNFEKGGRAVREWVAARNQLAILFAGRFGA